MCGDEWIGKGKGKLIDQGIGGVGNGDKRPITRTMRLDLNLISNPRILTGTAGSAHSNVDFGFLLTMNPRKYS